MYRILDIDEWRNDFMCKMMTVGLAGLFTVALLAQAAFAAEPAAKAPAWRLAIQAYTFRKFTFFEAVDKAKGLGLKYIEAYPGQTLSKDHKDVKFDHNMTAETQEIVKKKLKEAGITLVNYGVVDLGKDEASARKIFEFAKAMGIETICSEPAAKMLDTLDKLAEEYKINVAIHNHPKPSHYWDPQLVLDAVKGHSKRIGSCSDTGHWPRSGINPVEGLKKLEGHIICLHLKDLNELSREGHDVPWGTGKCDMKAMLTELKRQKFTGVFSIEYEHNWDNSVPEIAECVKYFNKMVEELKP